MTQVEEVKKRKTFAIISHPDAGKTTLTEKLLLQGGAIRTAGTVKARKSKKFATSDWMELEQQRGISITSSVMQFEYDGYKVNILDTPGHEDFSEDTYRTLLAVDSVVMIIDAAKGVEAQTIKLFKVCRERGIPIFTFINKLDRQGKDPLELFEELENVLGIQSTPVNFPIGMGQSFTGVYDRVAKTINVYDSDDNHHQVAASNYDELQEKLLDYTDEQTIEEFLDNLMLVDEAGNPFDQGAVERGELTPVFFGSAISGFGVSTFLRHFLQLAPMPVARRASIGEVEPTEPEFSGFIFKIQANMDPAHRDRVAFLRICSGTFERGMTTWLDRTGKSIKIAQPQQFFAESREIADKAYAGDILGVYDPGVYRIGDTLCGTKETFNFGDLPQFPPEHFAKVRPKNAMKQKHYLKGLSQLSEEGAIQVYKNKYEETILGAVGVLQFEVFLYRMKAEYGVELLMDKMPHQLARWVQDDSIADDALRTSRSMLVRDQNNRKVILFENEFSLRWFQDSNSEIALAERPSRFDG